MIGKYKLNSASHVDPLVLDTVTAPEGGDLSTTPFAVVLFTTARYAHFLLLAKSTGVPDEDSFVSRVNTGSSPEDLKAADELSSASTPRSVPT
jgi:hypothetical protein